MGEARWHRRSRWRGGGDGAERRGYAGRWITDETNARVTPLVTVLTADAAGTLGRFMREVVTGGTGRKASASVPVAGKTGTAELADAPSHAWFIGFAPYGGAGRKIAFSVLVENGVYGGAHGCRRRRKWSMRR